MNSPYPDGLPLALSLTGYNALFTGLFILLKRKDAAALCYFVSGLLTCGWAVGLSFLFQNELPALTAQAWARVSAACLVLTPVVWLHFVLVYTEKARTYWLNLALCYLVSLCLLAAAPTSWFIPGFRQMVELNHYPMAGPAFTGFIVIYACLQFLAFRHLFLAYREAAGEGKKSDYRQIFFAQLYGYGLTALSFAPSYGIPLKQWNLLFLPAWHFFLVFGMIRHHLLDYEALANAIHRDKLAALSTVTSGMHHELKNPLTTLKVFAEYLPQKYDDREFRQTFSEIIPEEVRRVNDLFQELLDFAKPREPIFTPTRLTALLEWVLNFLKHDCAEHGIEVVRDFAEDAEISADHDQLKQVFLNLFLNAIQAMPEGGTLEIQTRFRREGFVITISDTGRGIPKEILKKIFDPFFTTKKTGTGLGLSMVRQILRRHHGEIQLESDPGRGTRFYLFFKKAVLPARVSPS